MKKFIWLLILAFLVENAARAGTKYVAADSYIDVEMYFRRFYEENFTDSSQPRLHDNGYFTSELALFDKPEDMNHLLKNKLMNEGEIKEAIIESMLSRFAYARPNKKETKTFAEIIYKDIVDKFDIYWVTTSATHAKISIFLTSTCAVGAPEKMLVLAHKDTREPEQSAVYVVHSDVCD